jgi:hypothetical protein
MTSLCKNISLSLSLVSLLFVMGACDSFLEPERDNVYDEETLLKHPSKAEGVLLGAYSDLPGSTSFTDVATDNAVSNNNGNSYRKIVNGELTAENDPFSVWAESYTAIATLNHFLSDIVENVVWSSSSDWKNEHFRTRLTAEARGLRAFYYIRLLEAHAGVGTSGTLLGVPMVMESVTPEEGRQIPRSTYDDCVTMILEDLAYAEENLPMVFSDAVDETFGAGASDNTEYIAVYGAHFSNRFSAIVAKMLKARLLYSAACPAFNLTDDQTKWESAAEAAAEVIDFHGGLAALAPDRVEYYRSETNTDVLWRKSFSNINSWESNNFPPSMYGNGRVNPSQNLVDAFPAANGYPITMTESGYNPQTPYAGRDPRLGKYILYNGAQFKGTAINTVNDTQDGVDAIANKSTRTGYYLRKMMDEGVNLATGNVTTTRHFVTLLRYTEAYLIYAEAALNAYGATGKGENDYSATDVIRAIRSSAGIAQPDGYLAGITDEADLMKLIRNERRLELAFESDRYWDIRRHKDLAAMKEVAKGTKDGGMTFLNIENRMFDDYMIYGPVPYKEAQKGIEQNEGW